MFSQNKDKNLNDSQKIYLEFIIASLLLKFAKMNGMDKNIFNQMHREC